MLHYYIDDDTVRGIEKLVRQADEKMRQAPVAGRRHSLMKWIMKNLRKWIKLWMPFVCGKGCTDREIHRSNADL